MSASSRRRPTGRHSVRSARSVFVALLLSTGIAACDAGSTAPEVGGAEALQLSTALVDLAAGETHRLEIARTDDGALAVTWKSEDPQVASVDANGVVTARAVGETTVLASSKNAKASARIKVRGKKVDVASVSVSPDASTTTAIGDTLPLGVTVRDTKGKVVNGAAVTWSSLNPDVAAVDGSGRVVSRAVGAALIVAASGGMADTAAITSRQVVASVAVAPGSGEVDAGGTLRFEAKARDRRGVDVAGTRFVWTSSNTAVATVDNSGAVKGIAAGSAKITASAGGQSASADATVRDGQAQSPPPPSGNTPPPSSGSSMWLNEPAGMTLITSQAWNGGALPAADLTNRLAGWWRWDPGNNISITSQSGVPGGNSNALQFRFPRGMTGGNSPGIISYGSENYGEYLRANGKLVDELFSAFYFKLSDGWQQTESGHQKLLYLYQWDKNEQRNATVLFVNGQGGGPWNLHVHNEVAQDLIESGGWYFSNGAAKVHAGRWHKVEFYMKRSSSRGAPDGIYRVWLDGTLVVNVTNARLASESISEYHVDPVWGGSGGVKARDEYLWFSNFYLSGR